MGTTKDPEGFRRHTAGRRQTLGTRAGEGAQRRGCGLGAALLAVGLAVCAAALSMGDEPDVRALAATVAPSTAGPLGDVAELAEPEFASRDAAQPDAALDAERTPARASSVDLRSAAGAARDTPSTPDVVGRAPIQLLRGWSEAPLAEAEVFWIGRSDLARRRREGLTVTTVALAPVLQSHGRRELSSADGRLLVAADGCHLLVVGDGWTRELDVRIEGEGPTPVRVFAPRTLAIDIVDWSGRPALGFPVHFWRVDAGGAPRWSMRSLRASALSGEIRIEDVDALLQSGMESEPSRQTDRHGALRQPDLPVLERTRLRVALDADLAPLAWAEIDLAHDPLPHVRLQLPPLGELRILVAEAGGAPVAWAGRVELRGHEEGNRPALRELVDGRATFGTVRFGRALRVRAQRADGSAGTELELAPLTPDEPEREVVLADVAARPRLLLRPLRPDGWALPRTWCEVRLAAQRPMSEAERRAALESIQVDGIVDERGRPVELARAAPRVGVTHDRVVATNAAGVLELPIPDEFLELPHVDVVVSIVHEGRTLTSAPRRLARGEPWIDVDLGSVPLLDPAADAQRAR